MNKSEKNQSYKFFVGVDLSKEKFDAVVRFNSEDQQHRVFDNKKTTPGVFDEGQKKALQIQGFLSIILSSLFNPHIGLCSLVKEAQLTILFEKNLHLLTGVKALVNIFSYGIK